MDEVIDIANAVLYLSAIPILSEPSHHSAQSESKPSPRPCQTFSYSLPVRIRKAKQRFCSKATLCRVRRRIPTNRQAQKETYYSPFWGVSLTATRRLDDDAPEELPFGIVVTLKEMNGVNRIDNFVQNCLASRWIVEEIDLETSIDVYATAEQEIRFED